MRGKRSREEGWGRRKEDDGKREEKGEEKAGETEAEEEGERERGRTGQGLNDESGSAADRKRNSRERTGNEDNGGVRRSAA